MLRLFPALMMMLGMVTLVGCQTRTVQPVEPVPANVVAYCKHDGTCDSACHRQCTEQHVVCPKKARHPRHHHHKTAVKTETVQTTTQTTTQPAAQDSQTAAPTAQ